MTAASKPQWSVQDFHVLGDERGALVALEGGINVPFEVARVYYIFGTKPGVRRGLHAHSDLSQLAVCVSGTCTFLLDNGVERADIVLNSPGRGLYIGSMVWREMYDFSDDCVLMVLANAHYNESDYIRSYDTFIEMVGAVNKR
jgi:dTDP-4-dehydrorhamnose 3,5-epimerase-like enzyme